MLVNYLSFEIDPKDHRFLLLFWEGALLRRVYKHLFIKELVGLNGCKEKEAFLDQFYRLEVQIARREVVRLLSRKGYCSEELKQKLLMKGFSEVVVDQTLLYCQEKKYLDDEAHAERLIAKEFQKGHGAQWIHFKLKQKKLGREDKGGLQVQIENQERVSLQQFLKKNQAKNKQVSQHALVQKLLRRGYSYAVIRECILELN